MQWSKFEGSEKNLPEEVVSKSIEGFSNATNDLADLYVHKLNEIEKLNSKISKRFLFKLILSSPHLPDYAFKILDFGYNIELYPVTVIVPSSIMDELKEKGSDFLTSTIKIDDEEKLKKLLELVFTTKRFTEIVQGLIKIAKASKDDLPF